MRAVRRRARRVLTGRVPTATAAALLCAAALAACGGSDGDGGGTDSSGLPERPATLPAGFNLQLFTCADWQKADEQVRAYVIARLRHVTSGQVSGTGIEGRGTILPDDQAHDLFDNYCRQKFARGFVLYKVYGQAAGFAGGQP